MGKCQEMKDMISLMQKYIEEGVIDVSQVPTDDILEYIKEGFERLGIKGTKAIDGYRCLMDRSLKEQDVAYFYEMLTKISLYNDLISRIQEKNDKREEMRLYSCSDRAEVAYYRNLDRNRKNADRYNEIRSIKGFSGKGAVFTAVTGGYDQIFDPVYIDDKIDYYLFTDSNEIESEIWKVIRVENEENLDNARLARKIKITGCYEYLKDYDYTIWCDGNMSIVGDIEQYISKYSLGAPILCLNHYFNEDIYDEADLCIRKKRDDIDVIKTQIDIYRMEGMPENSGMIESGFMIRDNHSDILKKTMYDWWYEVRNHSKRDQLSFNYVCWKNSLLYDTSPCVSFSNDYIRMHPHS